MRLNRVLNIFCAHHRSQKSIFHKQGNLLLVNGIELLNNLKSKLMMSFCIIRGVQWNLTKYIGRRRLPRGLICIRFEDLTDFNCSSFWRFDKIEPKSVRYEILIRIYRELIVSWLLKKLIFYEIFDRNLVVYLVTKWYSPINDPLYYMIKYMDYNNWYQLHGQLLLVFMSRTENRKFTIENGLFQILRICV